MGDVTDKDYDATEGEGADGEQNEGGLVIDGGTELSIVPVEERNSFGEETAATQISDGIEDVKMVASQGNDTLYIGNICKLWTKELVLGALKSHGVKNIEDILLPGDTKKEGRIKGFALLEFNTHSDATAALERLRKPDVVFGLDSSANVAFAQTPIHPNQEVLSQVKASIAQPHSKGRLEKRGNRNQVVQTRNKETEIVNKAGSSEMRSAKRKGKILSETEFGGGGKPNKHEPHAGFIDPVNRKHGRTHPEYLKPPVGIQHQPRLGYLEHAVATPGQPRIPISEPDFGSHGRPYEVYLEPAVLTQSQPRIQVHEPGFGYHGRPHERYLEPAVRMHSHQSYAGYLEPAVRRQDQSHAGYYESALGKDGCNSYDLTLRRYSVDRAGGQDGHGGGHSAYGAGSALPPSYVPNYTSYAPREWSAPISEGIPIRTYECKTARDEFPSEFLVVVIRAVGAHPLRKAYCRRHPPQKAYWSIHALRSYLLLDDQPICGAFLCLSSVYVFGFALEAWVGLC
ncbi:hypothetical protein RHGRI_027789 [Rhododendron griersonianum]|uniref:RRM domain-containing protein n=1 Tax=Rhododendron griersonianum TaxID=479676 RepID=A0AAV6IZL2_9ERIC|nr:hypothetical protein RHGRI_027789 [Rhododendron griersonianum]